MQAPRHSTSTQEQFQFLDNSFSFLDPSGLIVSSEFHLVLKSVYSLVARMDVEFRVIARIIAPIKPVYFL